MSLSATALRKMLEMGLSADQMVELAEAIEEGAARPTLELSPGAVRTRKWREKKEDASRRDVTVTSQGDVSGDGHGDVTEPPALDKETSPTPPKEINPPPEGSIADAIVPRDLGDVPLEKAKAKLRAQADEIWAMQPVLGEKRRATKPDVAKAFAAAVSRGGAPADILASCRAYYAIPASTKDGGQYAMGAERLLAADRWKEFRPSDAAPHAVPVAWAGPEDVRDAILAETNDDFVRAYLLPSEWHPPEAHELLGSIRPRTSYAFDKLARLKCLSSVAGLLQPAPRSRAA